MMMYIMDCLLIADAAISSGLFLLTIRILTGWKKVPAEQGLKMFRIHCQNSAIIMRNIGSQVRQGVDIFDKRTLDSCKFHLKHRAAYPQNQTQSKEFTSLQRVKVDTEQQLTRLVVTKYMLSYLEQNLDPARLKTSILQSNTVLKDE